MNEREALKLALEALEYRPLGATSGEKDLNDRAIIAIKEALAQPEQEPVATMPSNTRYTVEVEGHGHTYWDNIHDAITNAQRAVYAGVDNTTRALDDLTAGRIAEWSYGFSAVRIYPPQNTTPPQRTWVGLTPQERDEINEQVYGKVPHHVAFHAAIEAKLKEKNT